MKIVKLNNEAREKLIAGVNKVVDAVRLTLGPSGYNAVLAREYKHPIITNDGVTIANDIELEDEIENLGAEVIKSVSSNTDKMAGDGTTTSMVLAQKILEEGFKLLDDSNLAHKPAMHIKKEIDQLKDLVIEKLEKMAVPVKSTQDIKNVALTSLEDEKLASILTEVIEEVGMFGLVTVEDSTTYKTEHRVEKGLEVNEGLVSPYLEDKDGEAKVLNARILVTNAKLNSTSKISHFTSELSQQNITDLVIFAQEFTNEVITNLVMNKLERNFNVIGVKISNDDDLKDLALISGATLVDVNAGMKLEDQGLEALGTADKVSVEKHKTIVVASQGDFSERVKELKEKLEKASQYDKQKIQKRISGFDKGVGIISVGANSYEERDYIKLKLEDGINAVRSAMELGVVKGGGLAFKEIAEELPKSILTPALLAPNKQIIENAGGNIEIDDSVVDPVKTLIKALDNACSVSGILLTTSIAVANKNERALENRQEG